MAQSTAMPPAAEEPASPSGRGERFVTNVLWGWLAVGVNLLIGIVFSRYIVSKLGAERYGIWVLVFSILDYFWFFDLGLNTAVTNFCARDQATREPEKINEVINTAVFYFLLLGLGLCGLTTLLSRHIAGFFQVTPAYQQEFLTLIVLTGISWGLCIILHMFVSALDGFQRFDLTSRVQVGMLILRSSGYALALALGYGLVQMCLVFVATQILGYALNFLNFRSVFTELRFSAALVRWTMFQQILHYGLRSFFANCSTLLLNQSAPVLIGHFLVNTSFVGFYALPSRLLQYALEAVTRIGLVTRSSSAEMEASGRREDVLKLGIYSNRYSFMLFLPLVLALLVYGRELVRLWMGEEFAANSAPLLPILSLAMAVAAGQFNSSAILFGLNKHGGYAQGLLVEAVANVVGMIVVIPRFGILGAAWVSASLMVLIRGLYTPWLVCQTLDFGFLAYMRQVYLRPALTALPILALGYGAKLKWLGGNTWPELIVGSGAIGLLYMGVAFFTCIDREHRGLFLSRLRISLPGRTHQ